MIHIQIVELSFMKASVTGRGRKRKGLTCFYFSKKKIFDFISLVEGLEKTALLIEFFSSHTLSSNLLTSLVTLTTDQGNP